MTEPFVQALALLFAAPIVGSFIGLLAVRLPESRPVVFGRSSCDQCGRVLSVSDLVPLLSAVYLRFRCRYCDGKIDRVQFIAEAGAIGVVATALYAGTGWILVASCTLGWLLLILALIDARHFLLPDVLTGGLLFLGLAASWFFDPNGWTLHLTAAVAGFALLFGVGWLYRILRGRHGLGLGDAKLLSAIGAWVSVEGFPSVLILAAFSGLVVVALMGLAGHAVSLKTKVPFGVFLAAAGWFTWLFGPLQFGPTG